MVVYGDLEFCKMYSTMPPCILCGHLWRTETAAAKLLTCCIHFPACEVTVWTATELAVNAGLLQGSRSSWSPFQLTKGTVYLWIDFLNSSAQLKKNNTAAFAVLQHPKQQHQQQQKPLRM